MTTWNSITIEYPGELTLATLPDALTSDGEIWEGYDAYDQRLPILPRLASYQKFGDEPLYKGCISDPDGAVLIEGHSKYSADEAKAALLELSKTTGRITHFEEWDDDEVGQRTMVYEGGEILRAEGKHSELVPDVLWDLLKEARKALKVRGRDSALVAHLRPALQKLVDALDPTNKEN